MATTTTPYFNFYNAIAYSDVKIFTGAYHVMLVSSAYTVNQTSDADTSNVNSYEIAGTGYTAGGKACTGMVGAPDPANVKLVVTVDPLTWTGLVATFRYAVIYKPSVDGDENILVGYVDFGTNQTYNGEDFQLTFPNGIVRLRKS